MVLFIIDKISKIIYYKPAKIMINLIKQEEIIIDVFVSYDNFLNTILNNKNMFSTLKI